MRCFYLLIFIFIKYSDAWMWRNGIVHYTINSKDYDAHSQDEIVSTLSRLQSELCIKFFNAPSSSANTGHEKTLFIHNPDKQKNCPENSKFDYSGNVVHMVLGYKCITPKEIARNVAELLRASIEPGPSQSSKPVTNNDISATILTADERNYLNLHYHQECGSLSNHPIPLAVPSRRANDLDSSDIVLSEQNLQYYTRKLWPLGILMYGVDPKLTNTMEYHKLHHAFISLQMDTCVVAQEWTPSNTVLTPKNLIWFGNEGVDAPQIGFMEGNQSVNLFSMVNGAPGHEAHVLANLVRALGIPMMSSRYDRDNYITVNWKRIDKGKEHFLEKAPMESWIQKIPYDFHSATHAPANYVCSSCNLGQQSIKPVQDTLWQHTLAMGHRPVLNSNDARLINILYNDECGSRGMK